MSWWSSSPYINRFLQPDTIIPNPYNPQSLNRYSYVLNNPINATDPTGHYCVGDLEGCRDEMGNAVNGAPLYLHHHVEDDDNEDGSHFGDILTHEMCPPYETCLDGMVFSGNWAAGMSEAYFYAGFDMVWTDKGLVVFTVSGGDIRNLFLELLHPTPHTNMLSPQFGISATLSGLASDIIRNKPGPAGIIQAYRNLARQEGFTIGSVTVVSSSSADSNGDPNFQTTTGGMGLSYGILDTISEYHRYTTDAQPTEWQWEYDLYEWVADWIAPFAQQLVP